MKLKKFFDSALVAIAKNDVKNPFCDIIENAVANELIADQSENLARLASLQDPSTGDTLLHMALGQLATYSSMPTDAGEKRKLNFCVRLAKKLLQEEDYASNVFLVNAQGLTPFDLMSESSLTWFLDYESDASIANTPYIGSKNDNQKTYIGGERNLPKHHLDNSYFGTIPIYFNPLNSKELANAHIVDTP